MMIKFFYTIDCYMGDNCIESFLVSKDRFRELFNILKQQGIKKFDVQREYFDCKEIWYYSEKYKDWFPFGSIYIDD